LIKKYSARYRDGSCKYMKNYLSFIFLSLH
jgi:hypothetical protein